MHAHGRELGRQVCVICETDENDARYLLPPPQGFGVDALWSDDFHHALHTLLTGESRGYYQDFGSGAQLARALSEGFAFQGEPFKFWDGKPRGTPAADVPLCRHVIASQNHDQVGNRARGERLTTLVPRGARKLAAALLLLAPETPLLFMGQEYDEEAPFQFFTDYGDAELQRAVREGRRKEFAEFAWNEVPDPQEVATFQRSRLRWPLDGKNMEMLEWYRRLIELRRTLVMPAERTCKAEWQDGSLTMQVPAREPRITLVAAFFGAAKTAVPGWTEALSADEDDYRVSVYTR